MQSERNPFIVSPNEALELGRELRLVWDAMFCGDEPGELAQDLERLAAWYGPKVRAASIAKRLGDMPATNIRERTLRVFDPPLLLGTTGRAVLTPEGRVALEDLYSAAADDTVVLHVRHARLLDLYRQWSFAPAIEALDLRGGRAGQTRPPAVGFGVLLLLTGAIGRERALALNTAMAPDREQALRDMFVPFTRAVSSGRGSLKDAVWSWPVSHAQKRFEAVRRDRGSGGLQYFWIDADGRRATRDEIAAELMRRRNVNSVAAAMAAVEALLRALDERRPVLGEDLTLPDQMISREAAVDGLRKACERIA